MGNVTLRPASIGSAVRVAIGEYEGDSDGDAEWHAVEKAEDVGDGDGDVEWHAVVEGDSKADDDVKPDTETVADCDGERETESVTLGDSDVVKLLPLDGELCDEFVCETENTVYVLNCVAENTECEGLAVADREVLLDRDTDAGDVEESSEDWPRVRNEMRQKNNHQRRDVDMLLCFCHRWEMLIS